MANQIGVRRWRRRVQSVVVFGQAVKRQRIPIRRVTHDLGLSRLGRVERIEELVLLMLLLDRSDD